VAICFSAEKSYFVFAVDNIQTIFYAIMVFYNEKESLTTLDFLCYHGFL